MKAVIRVDVPEWQIGQDVGLFFPDTMHIFAKCEADGSDPLKEQEKPKSSQPILMKNDKDKNEYWLICGFCKHKIDALFMFCPYCGREIDLISREQTFFCADGKRRKVGEVK